MPKGRLTIDTSPNKAIEKELADQEALFKAHKQCHVMACRRLTPKCRQLLEQSYNKSPLHTRSGDLLRMIRSSEVYPYKDGFRIKMATVFSKGDYAKSGALQYGAIYSTGTSSGRLRKKLKKNAKVSGANGYVPPKKYYKLDDGQADQLSVLYHQYFQEEMTGFMRKRGRRG